MHSTTGTAREVLSVFLALGMSAFGGPVAHLGHYRRELVERRRWISEEEYAAIVALCQFLPGPASSQVGFCLGWLRAGPMGAMAAFIAFTTPSALLMYAAARLAPRLSHPLATAALHGLALVAVAIVAHGVLGMARQLTPDGRRRGIAVAATLGMWVAPTPTLQLAVVAGGALAGLALCRGTALPMPPVHGLSVRPARAALALCAMLLVALPLLAPCHPHAALGADFFRAGALVFGGGHVVLPLLEQAVVAPGLVDAATFVAGYGAAQAMPGPLFTFAAFLGASLPPAQGGGAGGALVALLALFAPGLLLVAGLLPLWRQLTLHPRAAAAVAGVNAAVVGLLGAALYDPLWTTTIRSLADLLVAGVAFLLLSRLQRGALIAVLWCVLASCAGTLVD